MGYPGQQSMGSLCEGCECSSGGYSPVGIPPGSLKGDLIWNRFAVSIVFIIRWVIHKKHGVICLGRKYVPVLNIGNKSFEWDTHLLASR